MAIYEEGSLADLFAVSSPADGDVGVLVSPTSNLVVGCWRYRSSLAGWFPEGAIDLRAVRDPSCIAGYYSTWNGESAPPEHTWEWNANGLVISSGSNDSCNATWKLWSDGIAWGDFDGVLFCSEVTFTENGIDRRWGNMGRCNVGPSVTGLNCYHLGSTNYYCNVFGVQASSNPGNPVGRKSAWGHFFMSRWGSSGGTKALAAGGWSAGIAARVNVRTGTSSVQNKDVEADDKWGDRLWPPVAGSIPGIIMDNTRASGTGLWSWAIRTITFDLVEGFPA